MSQNPQNTKTSPRVPRPPTKKSGGLTARIPHQLSTTMMLGAIIVCVLVTAVGLSVFGGVVAGQNERDVRATQTTIAEIDLQYQLGLNDFQSGSYQLAAQRLRWVIEHDPSHSEAGIWLAEAERMMAEAGLVVQAPTLPPSESENPDELFNEAQTYFDSQQWENAITRLQELARLDPTYRTADVQGMLYEALRSLGLSYVRGDRIEEGLFLLEQAADIQPLDDQTEGERQLATLYATGESYWRMNWPVVIDNLQIVYDIAPFYRDVSELLFEARVSYGDQLASGGSYCGAANQYLEALSIEEDSAVENKYDNAEKNCADPSAIGTDDGTPGGLATATQFPTAGPSPTSGPSPTPGPTDTPTNTPDPNATNTPQWNIP